MTDALAFFSLRRRTRAAAFGALAALAPAAGLAYPGGTPDYQTDVAPFCASCHSSVAESELAGAPPERATKELAASKHLAQVLAGMAGTGYAELSAEDRKALADQIRALDAASKVRLDAPKSVTPGQEFEVTVTITGGGGPVSGVALVDAAHRWYARPASSAGWQVVAPPAVRGPGGKAQTDWLAKRPESAGRNLSYVNVTGIQSDATADKWADGMVIWKLRAPDQPGTYPLAAAYFYGTELGSPLGYKVDPKDPLQRKSPRGGFTGASGRVAFSALQQITVAP